MNDEELCFLGAVEQRGLLARKEIGVVELFDAHARRIEKFNSALNAFVTLCLDEAGEQAKAMDRNKGAQDGVLYGLPIGVKDCFATKGLLTTSACLALKDFVPDYDHLVVERERAAGAIILGKLNTPEFTMAMNTCDNPVFGPTRNPWDLSLCPGASSGGSGAALAMGLCSLADGSDIGGSVRNPAAWCNIVGHRPTTWMVPDVPNPRPWHNMNTPGPMARTVSDTALFLSVLAGPDPRSPVPIAAPFEPGLPALSRSMQDIRIGWSADLGCLPVTAPIVEQFNSRRSVFEEMGTTVGDYTIDLGRVEDVYNLLVYQRVNADVQPIYETQRDQLASSLAKQYERSQSVTEAERMCAEAERLKLWHEVTALFEKFDVLICPCDGEDAYGFDDEDTAQNKDWRLLYVAPLLNLPAIVIPCGFSDAGVPRGLQIMARPGADLLVLQVAYAFEQATRIGQSARPPLCSN